MGGKRAVMVVDDHEMIVNALVALLQSPILDIYSAESAEKALTICKAYKIDVAFIDARMRPISGLELIGIIRKKYPTVKVVGVTSFNEEATIFEFINAGVLGFLAKSNLSKTLLERCLQASLF